MSLVDVQIRRLDALLDKYQLAAAVSRAESRVDITTDEDSALPRPDDTPRGQQLKAIVRALSTTSSSRPLLSKHRLRNLVSQITTTKHEHLWAQARTVQDETELEWLATGKATVQMYGLILNSLLEQTIPLSESIWYWDDVLGSYLNTGLYTVQVTPRKFWKQAKEVYADAKDKFQRRVIITESAQDATTSITEGWRDFYALVQDSIQERSLLQARTRILSPFAISRVEVRKKQSKVKRLRETNATAIGLLVDEGLTFQPIDDDDKKAGIAATPDKAQWQSTIAKSVSLLENILRNATAIENSISEFEENVFAAVENDPEFVSTTESTETTTDPTKLANRLMQILDKDFPDQEEASRNMSLAFGKPSRWVRYWIPGVFLILSGSTLLRMFVNRKAEITQWIRDLGVTTRDFWFNWVVDPSKRLIGTIRHDEQSEIALMSKESLRADRESLERMVVDFAIENPENGGQYTAREIAEIREKVKEGDLTTVLKAYEREMQNPIKNALTGKLVRTLLIQIQKTKVDVEVAIGGIDSLLQSQELLFGFIGVAPGLLISYFVAQWVRGAFGGRRSLQRVRGRGETVRLLRNIDRTLNMSTPTQNGLLSYKDHGLLLCEIHVLRQRAASLLPGNIQREFLEDLDDLMNISIGIDRQMQVLERIQWVYAKWLQ